MQLQLHYTNDTAPHLQLHYNYNSTTLQLQLHYTPLHPVAVGDVTDQVTTATIVTAPINTTPTFVQAISGFALPSWFTTTNLSYRFLIFETSATALRGTAGITCRMMNIHHLELWDAWSHAT